MLPDSPLCLAAAEYARRVSSGCLFNHAMRTFAFGEAVGAGQLLRYDRELFFVAAVLHDLGLSSVATGAERFEVEGADLAKEFLAREGMAERAIDLIWDAIALHTSPGLPARKSVEAALVQLGAGIDVGYVSVALIGDARVGEVIAEWPRLDFKQAFPRLFADLFVRDPRAAASHVTAQACERAVEGFVAPHFCDVVAAAPFAE